MSLSSLVLVFRDSTDMKQRAERISKSRFDRLGAKQKKQMVAKPYEGLVRQRHCRTASLPFVEATVLSLFCVAAAVLVTLTVLLLLFLSPSLCCCCCSCHPHSVVTLTVLLLLFLTPSLSGCRVSGCQH